MNRFFNPFTALGILGVSFFGSLILAATYFPHVYDWRYTVMSSLASPRDNPHAYWMACTGLAISGFLLLPFPSFMRRRLKPFAPKLTIWAGRFFSVGAICLTLSALVVPGRYRVMGIGRSHEHLAQVSSVAFCLSLVLYFMAILRLPRPIPSIRILAGFAVLLPITALTVSRIALFLAYEFFSPTTYHAIKTSLWSSLALWEWVGALCVYLFLALMILRGPQSRTQPNDEE